MYEFRLWNKKSSINGVKAKDIIAKTPGAQEWIIGYLEGEISIFQPVYSDVQESKNALAARLAAMEEEEPEAAMEGDTL